MWEKGKPVHCWWEFKLMQENKMNNSMEVPQKIKKRTTI